MLATRKDTLEGKVCAISGSGNVASFAAQKLIRLGAKVVTLSDRSGTLYVKEGYTEKLINTVMNLKTVKRGELSELAKAGKFFKGANPWQIADKLDCAFPCSRQNELDGKDAAYLVVLFSPGKASNAGGVATSGLEMSQNSERMTWTSEQVDAKLKGIMKAIHDNAYEAAAKYGKKGNYVVGANIAGFVKVADAMVAQGIV